MCFTTRSDPDIAVPPRPISHTSRPTSRVAVAVITPPTHSTITTTNGLTTLPQPRSHSRSHSRTVTETRRLSSGQLVTVETISPRSSGTKIHHRSPRHSGTQLVHNSSPRLSGGSLVQVVGSPTRKRSINASPRHSNAVIITPTALSSLPSANGNEARTMISSSPRQSGNIVHFEDEEVMVVRPVRSRGYSSNGGGGGGGGWQGKSPRQSVGSVRSVSYRSTREKIVEVDDGGDRRGYERREGGRRSSRG